MYNIHTFAKVANIHSGIALGISFCGEKQRSVRAIYRDFAERLQAVDNNHI